MGIIGLDYVKFKGKIVCEGCKQTIQHGEDLPYPEGTVWYHPKCAPKNTVTMGSDNHIYETT